MLQLQTVNETVIVRLREGFNLEHLAFDVDSTFERAIFMQLKNTLKKQPGFLRQFWGHQVEDPSYFVWFIDWESMEKHDEFIGSEGINDFNAGMGKIFDFEKAAPIVIHSHFNSDTTATVKAPVTKIAIMTLPNSAGEEAKKLIDSLPINDDAIENGKVLGAANGWVSEVSPKDAAPAGKKLGPYTMYGFTSIADHAEWTQTVEFEKGIESAREVAQQTGMGPFKIHGRDVIHVRFEEDF